MTHGTVIAVEPHPADGTVVVVEWADGPMRGETQRFGTSRALQRVGLPVIYDGKTLQEATR